MRQIKFWLPFPLLPFPFTTDLRLISLTPTHSKVAEHFIVDEHVKPAISKKLGSDQFGCIPGTSTIHALVSIFHNWAKATDELAMM